MAPFRHDPDKMSPVKKKVIHEVLTNDAQLKIWFDTYTKLKKMFSAAEREFFSLDPNSYIPF